MNSPLVSVIIPFYNRYDWVFEAIKSVLDQTLTNFDIILVDDASTDHCSIDWDKIESRIRYVRLDKQSGPSAARNVGIDLSSAEYVAFLDSDDLFVDDKLETQIKMMEKHNSVFSHTSYWRISADRNILDQVHSGNFSGNVYPNIYLGCPIATPTVMVKREILKENRFLEQVEVAEDILLWINISKQTMCLGIDIPLSLVRMHKNNTIYSPNKQIQGLNNIINFGVLGDKNLDHFTKHNIKSTLFLNISHLFMLISDPFHAVKFGLLAFFNDPPNVVNKIIKYLGSTSKSI